jgi:hypothetical protein
MHTNEDAHMKNANIYAVSNQSVWRLNNDFGQQQDPGSSAPTMLNINFNNSDNPMVCPPTTTLHNSQSPNTLLSI